MQKVLSLGRKLAESGTTIMVAGAATSLAALMFLMAFDVVGRYFFNTPIPGGLEVVEYLMAILVPFAVGYAAVRRTHVSVDLVVDRLPGGLRRGLDKVVTLISIVFVLLICWQNFLYIIETYHCNLTSAVLQIPAFPFVAPLAVGMLVYAIAMTVHLFSKKQRGVMVNEPN